MSIINNRNNNNKQLQVPCTLNINGRVQSIRRIHSQNLYFIDLNDGSTSSDLQIVINESDYFKELEKLKNGDDIFATGTIDWRKGKPSERSICDFDLYIDHKNPEHKLDIYRNIDEHDINPVLPNIDYKYEYLRKYPHLRFQNKKFATLMRIRDEIRKFTYDFFKKKNFTGIDTPYLTYANCENLITFKVKDPNETSETGMNKGNNPKKEELKLSATGQMELEYACYGMGKVWKMGPSFRGEKSDTNRHSYEFVMVEAELSNTTIKELIDSIEELIRDSARFVLDDCTELLEQASKYNDKLKDHLSHLSNIRIRTMTYDDAINMLNEMRKSEPEKYKYQYIDWGGRLSDSHEKSLMDHYDNKEIIAITNYPESITPFYMKRSVKSSGDHSKTTVENFDIIAPFGYEIAGGSLREDDYKILKRKMEKRKIYGEDFDRYLRMRKYTHLPHGGYGIGFDRLIMLMTMNENIKDIIPFPLNNI